MDKSWGQGHLPHSPWSWMERCRLPWSRHRLPSGCLECGRNIKHPLTPETTYPVMETHANSTPVQVYATRMCLPKGKAKKHGHCQKSCQGFGQLFGKGRLFGRPFFKTNPQELSTLCIYPKNSWTTQRTCQSKQHCLSQMLPKIFYPATYEEHSINKHDLDRALFLENVHWKEMHQLLYRTWWGMILKGIFLSNFWNLYML